MLERLYCTLDGNGLLSVPSRLKMQGGRPHKEMRWERGQLEHAVSHWKVKLYKTHGGFLKVRMCLCAG